MEIVKYQDMLKTDQLLVSWSHLTKTMTQDRYDTILGVFFFNCVIYDNVTEVVTMDKKYPLLNLNRLHGNVFLGHIWTKT